MVTFKVPFRRTGRRAGAPVPRTSDADSPVAGASTHSAFAAFRHTNFRYLWGGSVFSSSAMFIQQVTLNWLVYGLTNSAFMLALVNAVRLVPWVIMSPISGVLADRFDRRKLILYTQILLAVSTAIFAVVVLLGYVNIWHIFAFTVLVGVGNNLNNTARQSVMPQTVGRADLVNAVAWTSISQNATRTVGPAIGGVLISLLGIATNFFVQAGCYVGTFLSVFPMKPDRSISAKEHRPFFYSMGDGFRYLLSDRPALGLTILGVVPMFFIFPAQTLIPIFARDIFHSDATGYGIFLMSMGLGSLLGTAALAFMGEMKRKAIIMYALLAIAIGASIVFAWMRLLPLALLVLAVQGAAQMTYFAINNSTLQMRVPDEVLGRVLGVNSLNVALIPAGGMVAGLLAEHLGAPMALTIMGVTGLMFVVGAILALPSVRKL